MVWQHHLSDLVEMPVLTRVELSRGCSFAACARWLVVLISSRWSDFENCANLDGTQT